MKKFLYVFLLLPMLAFAAPQTITFNSALPISKSSDPYNKPGCETSTQGYIFDVTMLGWNLSTSSCTATNLFSNLGYLTTGQYAPRSRGQFWMAPTTGTPFALLGFTIKNYGTTNTLYLDTTDSAGVITTTVLPPAVTVVGFDPTTFPALTAVSIRSTNNRFDITNIIVQ